MKRIVITLACVAFLGTSLCAQESYNDTTQQEKPIKPIASASLQGRREATAAEKEYAKRLAEAREQQRQIDYNLPPMDENGQVVAYNDPVLDYGWGWDRWRLHKGLNLNVGTSVFANFGNGSKTRVGFTQDVSLMYVTNLSNKLTLAVGGYFNNLMYGSNNYTTAGINAVLGYRFDEHWSAYAFVQKAFTSDNVSPYMMGFGAYGYGMGYAPMYSGWGYMPYHPMGYYGYDMMANRFMDRFGAGVTYQWGERNQNSISISFEYDRMPQPRNGFYNYNRYDYPVR